MFSPIIVLVFSIYIFKDKVDGLIMSACLGLFLAFLCLWVFNNQVIVASDGIIHGRMPWFCTYLAFKDIEDFYTTIPLVNLIIKPTSASGKKQIVIPFNLFSAADKRTILNLLSEHVPRRR
jgi:hypothetical protein